MRKGRGRQPFYSKPMRVYPFNLPEHLFRKVEQLAQVLSKQTGQNISTSAALRCILEDL